MSDAIDFYLIQTWEPTGKQIRVIESAETFAERARKLMVRYRRVTEGGVPAPEKDSGTAVGISELAGLTMRDTELVRDISRFLKFSGWSEEYCFGLACNIAFANLEESDQFSYLQQP